MTSSHQLVQVAYAVDDVVAAATRWVERGVGPFFVREHIEVDRVRIGGQPGSFDHSSAYGWWGDVMIELICDHADQPIGPTVGVHHLAYLVDDLAEAQASMTEAGWPEALFAHAGSTAFAMHDATADLGHLIEMYSPTEGLTGFYAMVETAAITWDGTDPIRML